MPFSNILNNEIANVERRSIKGVFSRGTLFYLSNFSTYSLSVFRITSSNPHSLRVFRY